MGSQARAINYYTHGSVAPTIQAMVEAETRRMQLLQTEAPPKKKVQVKKEQVRHHEKAKAVVEKAVPGISVFAVLGTLFVAVLMVFVVLAQINFNETAAESVRLNVLIGELNEKQRALELSFESALDIKEVERFARDELGMSRPDAGQIIVFSSTPRDTAIVLNTGEDRGIQGFGNFLKSLTEYFR